MPPTNSESLICCPVCTLYLREGITLEDHLETHPKEQIISAFIRERTAKPNAAPSCPSPSHTTAPFSYICSSTFGSSNHMQTTAPSAETSMLLCTSPAPSPSPVSSPGIRHNTPRFTATPVSDVSIEQDWSSNEEILLSTHNVTEDETDSNSYQENSPSPMSPAASAVQNNNCLIEVNGIHMLVPVELLAQPDIVQCLQASFSVDNIGEDAVDSGVQSGESVLPDNGESVFPDDGEVDTMRQNSNALLFYPREEEVQTEEAQDVGTKNTDIPTEVACELLVMTNMESNEEAQVLSQTNDKRPLSPIMREYLPKIETVPPYRHSKRKEVLVPMSPVSEMPSDLETAHVKPVEPVSLADVKPEKKETSMTNIHECLECGRTFRWKSGLRLHKLRHAAIRPFSCLQCPKAFVTRQKLNEHLNVHTGATPLRCLLCPKTFRRYSNLAQHRLTHKDQPRVKKQRDYLCNVCHVALPSRRKLAWHQETHARLPHTCPHCGDCFIHSASLTRHVRVAHDRNFVPSEGRSNDNANCTICGGLYLKSSLAAHMRKHTGDRPFRCDVCGKAFGTKSNLQAHRWLHASRASKPFKCSMCTRAYVRESDLNAHIRAHKNSRPFTCNQCGQQFIHKHNFKRHVSEHDNEKRYACTQCDKSFHRSYYLKDHMRTHSGARPFVCHVCGKSSATKSNHNSHLKIHHAREPVNLEG